MSKKDEALKLALEALEDARTFTGAWPTGAKAITAIREALAEQPAQQEPVAVKQIAEALRKHGLTLVKTAHSYHVMDLGRIEAQTTSPPASKPLTRDQVKEIMKEAGYEGASAQHRADFINGIRHGEAALGIKEQP